MAQPTQHPYWRSVGAVLLGYVVMSTLVIGGFFMIGVLWPDAIPTGEGEQAGMGLSVSLLILALGQGVVGGYVTATTARHDELVHGAALIGLMLLVGAVSLLSGPEVTEPSWYALASIATGASGVLLGAQFRVMHRAARNEDADGGMPQSYHPAYRKGPQT